MNTMSIASGPLMGPGKFRYRLRHFCHPIRLLVLCALSTACGGVAVSAGDGSIPVPADGGVPMLLSQTGLFADVGRGIPAPGVEGYAPAYPLWSDGAQKTRWFRLPAGGKVDTGDMDHWSVPVGMRFWKEFRLQGRPVETRMITRSGPGPDDFTYAVYKWNDRGDDAEYMPDGASNAGGSGHDIPGVSLCPACHGNLREHVLGFSAIQLSHSGPGTTIATLSQRGLLTVPATQGFPVPGDAIVQPALGYLHGNCGHCHNPDGISFQRPYALRLLTSAATPEETGAYLTAVGVPTEGYKRPGITYRIAPGDPAASAVFHRMSARGTDDQMPPIGTNLPDPGGIESVRAWIGSLISTSQ